MRGEHSDSSKKKFSETDIKIFAILIDNIFVLFGGCVLTLTVDSPVGTNCAFLLANLFLYSYETDFIQEVLNKNENKLSRFFNFTFRYKDYLLSLK